MRIRKLEALLLLVCCVGCQSSGWEKEPERALFVGNSLIYVGNTPAVFSALSASNAGRIESDMIVRGGATLIERVVDNSVADALKKRNYTLLVLQERGGDLMCSFGPESCMNSRKAIEDLARLAMRRGVKTLLLGSYQINAEVSKHIVEVESSAAAEAGIPYLEVSETFRRLREVAPDQTWFASDGIHPGKDLALLNAIILYRSVRGKLPDAEFLTVKAPIYEISSGLKGELRASDAPPPRQDTPLEQQYPVETVRILADGIGYARPAK